ncbi:Hypothetical protein AJF4211_000210 [Avibacterium paragallinarum JF4211]|nr:Hypothetical protein AJF4211_000210 [Avibacterium paragallinarum JF4211]
MISGFLLPFYRLLEFCVPVKNIYSVKTFVKYHRTFRLISKRFGYFSPYFSGQNIVI